MSTSRNSILSGIRKWFVSITIIVVVAALFLGGSYLIIVQLLPDIERQNFAQITLSVSLAVLLANGVVAIMQWLGVSPLDLLPERSLKESLKKQNRNLFILSFSKNPSLLSAQTKAAKEEKKYDWMYLFSDAWVRCQPLEPNAYEMLGEALLEIGFTDDAINAGHKLIELEPLNYEGFSIVGEAYSKQSNWQQARQYYEKALEVVSPSRKQFILSDILKIYDKLGLVEECLIVLDELMPLHDHVFQTNYYGEKREHFMAIKMRRSQSKIG